MPENKHDSITPIERAIAANGVHVVAAEVAAIVGSLARIEVAVRKLAFAPGFDEAPEHFYRLLEQAGSERSGR